MHGRRYLGFLVGAALLVSMGALAPSAAAGDKKRAKKTLKDSRLQTRKLFSLEWHDSWKAAVTRNRVIPRKARPIVFLRILGDLADKT